MCWNRKLHVFLAEDYKAKQGKTLAATRSNIKMYINKFEVARVVNLKLVFTD